jgi:hypothetical protein
MPEPRDLSLIERKFPSRLSRLLGSKGFVIGGLWTIGAISLRVFDFGTKVLDWAQRFEFVRNHDNSLLRFLLWFLTPTGGSALVVISVTILLFIIGLMITAPRQALSTSATPERLEPEPPPASAAAQPSVTFEIDEDKSQVRMGRGNKEIRRIHAEITLRCSRESGRITAIRAFHISLLRSMPNGVVSTIIAQEDTQVARDVTTGESVATDEWIIADPLTKYRVYIFDLFVTPKIQMSLSPDHFLRVTMDAVGQGIFWQDVHVENWELPESGCSAVSLKAREKFPLEALKQIGRLKERLTSYEKTNEELGRRVEDLKATHDRATSVEEENLRLKNEVAQLQRTNTDLVSETTRLQSKVNQYHEQYEDLESTTKHIRFVAHFHASGIASYVHITKFEYGQHELLRRDPYIEFAFFVTNNSVYPVILNPDLTGSISFAKRELKEERRWERRTSIPPNKSECFRIRQSLTQEDVIHILNGTITDLFVFRDLGLQIIGDSGFEETVRPADLFIQQPSLSNEKLLKTYSKLDIEIAAAKFNWIQDQRSGTGVPHPDEPCFVTLYLKLTNRRKVSSEIQTFKMRLNINGEEHTSFAEPNVYYERVVNQRGLELGTGSYSQSLTNNLPLVLIEDKVVEGAIQFIFKELKYLELLTKNLSLENASFTLLLIDKNGEEHRQRGLLPREGNEQPRIIGQR